MTAPELVDPRETAFWASDPSVLSAQPALPPAVAARHRPRTAEVGVALAAAFLVTRALVASDLAREPAPEDVSGAAARVWRRHAPVWLRFAVPAISHAYSLGAVQGLTQAELEAMAGRYALGLGDYLSTTSAQALAAGFDAQLAGRWNERVAWTRARAGYGLDRQHMLSYLAGLTTGAGEQLGSGDLVGDAGRALVEQALLRRADTLGQAEAWRAMQSGKAIAWLAQQRHGALPAGALKEWDTTEDESTCPICAPLDKVAVPLAESFDTIEGKLFSPGAHPRCRCDLKLRIPEPIRKDLPGDPFDRDTHGRFAHREQRHPRGTLTLIERAPAQPPAPAEKQTLYTEPAPDTGLYATSGLYTQQRTPLYAKAKLYAEPETALYAKPATEVETTTQARARAVPATRLHITFVLPPPPPKPEPGPDVYFLPQEDVQQYYDENFDSEVGAFDGMVHFGDIVAHYGGAEGYHWGDEDDYHDDPDYLDNGDSLRYVPAPRRYDGPFAGITPQFEWVDNKDWAEVLKHAVPIWHRAHDDPAEAARLLNELDSDELYYINAWAGRKGYSEKGLIRDHILEQIAHPDPTDDSLASAFADYVTFVRPDLVDIKMIGLLASLGFDPDDHSVEPSASFVMNEGLHPADTPEELRNSYRITGLRYRSAIGQYGAHAPKGHIGTQEWYLAPREE